MIQAMQLSPLLSPPSRRRAVAAHGLYRLAHLPRSWLALALIGLVVGTLGLGLPSAWSPPPLSDVFRTVTRETTRPPQGPAFGVGAFPSPSPPEAHRAVLREPPWLLLHGRPALDDCDLKADDLASTAVTAQGRLFLAGDTVRALMLSFDWVNNQGPGAVDQQPEAVRQRFLDKARTLPLLLAAPAPPALSCATLGGVKAPTLVIAGERTQRFFSLISEAVVRCLPGSRLVTIPQATHAMFVQQSEAFNAMLMPFLAQH